MSLPVGEYVLGVPLLGVTLICGDESSHSGFPARSGCLGVPMVLLLFSSLNSCVCSAPAEIEVLFLVPYVLETVVGGRRRGAEYTSVYASVM